MSEQNLDLMNPCPQFTTERLILRAVRLSDAEVYEKYFATYDVISQLSDKVPWPYPKGGVEDFFKNTLFPVLGNGRWFWVITLKSNPSEPIGAIDLWREGIPEHRGFWLGKPFWGKGYMTEAVIPVMNYAFNELGFEKLVFSNALGNARSRRIKEKTGARFLGTRPAKFVDPNIKLAETWELTKEEWKSHKP